MCVSLYRQLHFPKHVLAYPRWIMIRSMHPNIEKNEKKKKEKIFIVSLDLDTSMYQCMVIWLFKTKNMNLRFVKLASVFKNDSFLLGKKNNVWKSDSNHPRSQLGPRKSLHKPIKGSLIAFSHYFFDFMCDA